MTGTARDMRNAATLSAASGSHCAANRCATYASFSFTYAYFYAYAESELYMELPLGEATPAR